ncbi:MAG TPA: (Fe-S)-binding protein [Dehalococcoidales bacterium]|nr:MAG: hypothetical protein A2Z05_07805 [Chloroflexi bacterium RBG_16_60_22]HJX13376.1 (Fe-S)-binding protein [Dehalococcoidales bacterium]
MNLVFAEKYDLFKCFQCGKCSAGCPVLMKGPLNIRRLIREVLLRDDLVSICQRSEIWDCTTCQACTLRCPRGLRPHELLMGIRGSLVEAGKIPETVSEALENVFKQGNPWGWPRSKRHEWAADLGVKDLTRGDRAGRLLFVGCAPAYDPRVQSVTRALAGTLLSLKADFAILGNEETCCGSEVRRMGEEGLFEMLAEDNSRLFSKYNVTDIMTISPHCYNVFKNEYQNGGRQVKHYTQVISGLIGEGKLTFPGKLEKVVTYHDPCYLGKQNGIFDEPRNIIKAIPGINFIEFDRSRERSLCCEGGGGRMFVEASPGSGERLALTRIADAVKMGADIVATACPFCLLNLEDAVKTAGCEDKIQVRDIMELVAEAIRPA